MNYDKKVILLAGPTASGKSELAIKLGKYLSGEIKENSTIFINGKGSQLIFKSKDKKIEVKSI